MQYSNNCQEIISYQAITGNNNRHTFTMDRLRIISYQAITGNNNATAMMVATGFIISYQAITGNNNLLHGIKR